MNMRVSNIDDLSIYSINNAYDVNNNIKGYWLLSSSPYDEPYAYGVNLYGSVRALHMKTYYEIGIRPVITVSKQDLIN